MPKQNIMRQNISKDTTEFVCVGWAGNLALKVVCITPEMPLEKTFVCVCVWATVN